MIKELNLNKIYFLEDFDNKKIQETINIMKEGEICIFENIRFWKEEEENNLKFAKDISSNFEAYVNDAFSASHREHASIVSMPKFLPSYIGFGMLAEIDNINSFIINSKRPNLAIVGGSKISSKINLLLNLLEQCDTLVIGGAMANTFLHANNINIGNSLCEKNLTKNALLIIDKAKKCNCKIIIPLDVVCADNINDKINLRECNVDDINSEQMVLDIGSKTTKIISKHISEAKSVLWNGPLGAFEYKPFDEGSIKVAKMINSVSKSSKILTIAGGGDTISVIKSAKAENGFNYISKAGGAFLEWLEGKESPGVIALKKN